MMKWAACAKMQRQPAQEEFLGSARRLAARVYQAHVRPGDRVVDATLGNGHDCLQLCRLVGEGGQVHGFDVQEQALTSTRFRLKEAGLLQRASLHLLCHQHLAQVVPQGISLACFNLGWLPGGDKAITTRVDSTLKASEASLALLGPGGLLVMCIYPGHPEGSLEEQALLHWAGSLRPQQASALHQRFLNAGPGAPSLLLIEKL